MINQELIIQETETLIHALHQMDQIKHKMLLAFSGKHFISILTIGDLQRAIIANPDMSIQIKEILKPELKVCCNIHQSIEEIKKAMMRMRCEIMPIVDDKGELIRTYQWKDIFNSNNPKTNRPAINLPVVIMAGGKGTRLSPLTNVIPKPLIPVGDKTILEVIMDQFESIGCNKFYMSVNYKADMMKYYLSQLDHKYDIDFFMEDTPLGTIGSVSLLKGRINTPFFVSNCDSINEQDYRDVYDYHINNSNDMTIVTMIKSFKIPYGVIETGVDGLMTTLKEKPEQTYQINTGVYILNPNLIDEIPEGKFFHITHLMERVQKRGGRVGCFPVNESSWKDMGEWPEYLKMIKNYM